ncbi:tetratricopeptide repeat protein [Zeaxanthinibacter sp. PT1]|uniref:tetratricopeptide repeat protein n=1 Tax=Zeaxanthinibacter TaxID=561554 RepID=UPI00234A13FF|nr:tetratricopeptide repeat protein [Zeaxanthinibacter sp. PT1]MDC6350242.1 tetratricopeptide repeat protein [Zeaxanthinibacter sp. PT1]
MYTWSTRFTFFLFMGAISILCAQDVQNDSVSFFFNKMEEFADQHSGERISITERESLLRHVEGREKVQLLLDLSKAHMYKDIHAAKTFSERALILSSELGFKKGILQSKYQEAYLLFIRGDFDRSFTLASEVLSTAGKNNFLEEQGDVLTLITDIYSEKGHYDKALQTGLELLDIAETHHTDHLYMRAYAALSHYYLRTENYEKALSYCLKGIPFIIRLGQTQYFFPKIDEIARMKSKLSDVQSALKAYAFYEKLEVKMPPPGDYIESAVHMNMADIYLMSGNLDKAQAYLSRALEKNYEKQYRFRIPRALILQGQLLLKQNDTVNAIKSYEESLEAAEQINAFDVVKDNSEILSQLYQQTDQPGKSSEYKALFETIRDSIFTNEQEQKIVILETKRNVKEISQRKRILELENEKQQANFNTLFTLLMLVLTISGLSVYSYFKVRSKNKLLYNKALELAKVQSELKEKLRTWEINSVLVEDKKEAGSNCQTMDDDVKAIILAKLENLECENFFLDPCCNLHSLAESLKTNPKYLSQVINQEKGCNFNNYLNCLRIDFLIPKLIEDEDLRNSKLCYIATTVGFNTLNTFNSAFKKRQGILPSYFIKELNQAKVESE